MAQLVWADFFSTTLAAAVTSGDTSISVASAANAPTIAAGEQWIIAVQSSSTPSSREIMAVTAITSTTFTVTRAQEGTSAGTWAIGDIVFGTNTAGQMAALQQLFSGGAGTISANTTLTAANANTYWNLAAGYTATLPAASAVTGKSFGFFATGGCTLASGGGSFYGGSLSGTSVTLSASDWLLVQSDGTNYRVVAASPGLVGAGLLAATQTWTGGNTFSGSLTAGAGMSVSNGALSVAGGNINANTGRVRSALGATGSGDTNACTILGDFPASLGNPGYTKLPNGLILQSGFPTASASPGSANAVTYPLTFPTAQIALFLTISNNSSSTQSVWELFGSTSGFSFACNATGVGVSYLAIGY